MGEVLTPRSPRPHLRLWHGGCLRPVLGRCMSFRPFTSESYAQHDRPEAWRDVLSAVGLKPDHATVFYDGHATASHRHAPGVALTRLSSGAQAVSRGGPSHEDLPIALMPLEDGVVLRNGAAHR